MIKLVYLCLVILISVSVAQAETRKPVRVSTWYWLNSIERERWERDFQAAAAAGFTDLILCWGLDAAAVARQKENTRLALELCRKHKLKAYLFIWHPTHNSLPRNDEFLQVDNRGTRLYSFNLFHRKWRATQWRDYLREIALAYRDEPALAGYLFDDTFHTGGAPGSDTRAADFVSYSPYDIDLFRVWVQRKYKTLGALATAWQRELKSWQEVEPPRQITAENSSMWRDWCEARRDWLREWAEETVEFIREADPAPEHEIYAEDTQYALGVQTRAAAASHRPITIKDATGLDFGHVMQPFDAVCGYTFFGWDAPDALERAVRATRETLAATRAQVGADKKIIYTFWASDADVDRALPLTYPTAEQIIAIARTALSLGVDHVDYYGFRIGDWRVSASEWLKLRPGASADYPLTKPMTGRFLVDRDDLLKSLGEQHRRLTTETERSGESK